MACSVRVAAVRWLQLSARRALWKEQPGGRPALGPSFPWNGVPSCAFSISRSRTPERSRDTTDASNADTSKMIWEGYKRNFKGQIPPAKTRLRCKRGTKVVNNPCPICKNEIEIHYEDTGVLEQFVSPHTGEVLEASVTGLCRMQQKKMVAAIEKAQEHGLLKYTIPREFPEEPFRIPPWNKIDVRES